MPHGDCQWQCRLAARVLLSNFVLQLCWQLCTYGFWHWFLYVSPFVKGRMEDKKFNPVDPYADKTEGTAHLVREVTLTTCGFVMSSLFEVAVLHWWATGTVLQPYYSNLMDRPLYSLFMVLIVPYWRDAHFYIIHRAIHPWKLKIAGVDPGKVLYTYVHSWHHKSNNPGPWSGLSMHPVEHLLYYTCTLLPVLFTLHPVHFLFNKFHADVSPVAGHDGFADPGGNSLFHYYHHALFQVNFGTPMVPMDKLFGTLHVEADGAVEKRNT